MPQPGPSDRVQATPATATGALEQTRFKGMMDLLQQQDPEIDHIVAFSKFVVAYLLQQDGPSPGWRKANIEGPVYLVRRRVAPRYQLLVKNQFSTNDLLDNLHAYWEIDCQTNYIFYKVEDESKRIRGLWFHEDAERQRIEAALEQTLDEIRNPNPSTEPQTEPMPKEVAAMNAPEGVNMDTLYAQFGLTRPPDGGAQDRISVTMGSLRSALHELVDDDAFLRVIMQRLKDHQQPAGRT